MGIDAIGKKGVPLPSPGIGGPSPTVGTERPFEASGGAPVPAPAPAEAARGPLEQLRTGGVGLERYLDLKVDEATAHLGPLSPSQLEMIRSVLRERIASDPTLVDLVHAATGAVPAPPPHDD
jgi:hypothetical protein